MRPPRYAVIPTNGRECLTDCVDAIIKQVDRVIYVCTARQARGKNSWYDQVIKLNDEGPLNISRWWNQGLEFVTPKGHFTPDVPTKWDVAIINDDVIVPEGWFDAVAGKMRDMRAAAACSGGAGGMPVLHTHAGPVSLDTRMQGFAFVLAGESGLRADEQFRWYCGDDDLGWRAAAVGGMVMIPGFHVNHLYPNQQVTPEMQGLIAEDMQRFVDKWKTRPW